MYTSTPGGSSPAPPAYCRGLDAGGLKAALAQAYAGRIADYRARADEAVRAYFDERHDRA